MNDISMSIDRIAKALGQRDLRILTLEEEVAALTAQLAACTGEAGSVTLDGQRDHFGLPTGQQGADPSNLGPKGSDLCVLCSNVRAEARDRHHAEHLAQPAGHVSLVPDTRGTGAATSHPDGPTSPATTGTPQQRTNGRTREPVPHA